MIRHNARGAPELASAVENALDDVHCRSFGRNKFSDTRCNEAIFFASMTARPRVPPAAADAISSSSRLDPFALAISYLA